MDFAVCPSCGQSVLDDDAEDCPFCGASMKAKPGAKAAAAAKPAAPAKPAAAPAKPGVKPGAKPDPKAAADDFPFDAEMMQPSNAIAASATAGKGRTLQVLCPMCETAGFVPTSAAGKMVKCANPKCMVPLFRAPAPEAPKPVAPPPPPPKNNLVTIGIVTAVVVATLGGASYLYVTMSGPKTPTTKVLTPEELKALTVTRPSGENVTTVTPVENPDGTPKTTTDAGPATSTNLTAFKAAIFKDMSEMALLSGGQNRSKPLCRRLAAEAFAIDGQIKAARDQISNLGSVGKDVPFYRVVPWVEVAWAELAVKKPDLAKTALDQALTESATLPKFGRDRLITATYLAAALAGVNRVADAQKVLKDRESSDVDGELAFAWCWLTFDRQATDLEASFRLAPLLPRAAMQTAATAAVLTLRGQSAEALKFAGAVPGADARRDAFAGWIEAQIRTNPTFPVAEIDREFASLSPSQKMYVLARGARMAASLKNRETAQALLAPAVEMMNAQAAPNEFTIPALKPLMKWKPASTDDLVALATAIGEVAAAQHEVGEITAVEATLNKMLTVTRAIGPAMALPLQKQKEIDGLGLTAMRDKLKKELDIRNEDDARQALGVYRQAVANLTAAAKERFEFQSTALSRAAALGMEKTVWGIVSQRTATEDAAAEEPYFQASVPAWLLFRFQATNATDDANALTAAYEQKLNKKIELPLSAVLVDQLLSGKSQDALAAMVNNKNFKGESREAVVMRGVAALIQQDATEAAWVILAKQDPILREQAYQLAALLMARKGKSTEAWKRTAALNGATEKESIGRGIIGGLRDTQP